LSRSGVGIALELLAGWNRTPDAPGLSTVADSRFDVVLAAGRDLTGGGSAYRLAAASAASVRRPLGHLDAREALSAAGAARTAC
jgi:hypothetical protein